MFSLFFGNGRNQKLHPTTPKTKEILTRSLRLGGGRGETPLPSPSKTVEIIVRSSIFGEKGSLKPPPRPSLAGASGSRFRKPKSPGKTGWVVGSNLILHLKSLRRGTPGALGYVGCAGGAPWSRNIALEQGILPWRRVPRYAGCAGVRPGAGILRWSKE